MNVEQQYVSSPASGGEGLRPGTRVTVTTRYLGEWVEGFAIVSVDERACTLRRLSDGWVLPDEFPLSCIRPQ